MSSFEINDVFIPTGPLNNFSGPTRVVETIDFKNVVLIDIRTDSIRGPRWVAYEEWIRLIDSHAIIKIPDPYDLLTAQPGHLPPAAHRRFINIIKITESFYQTNFLSTSKEMRIALATVAEELKTSKKTVERWIYGWLKSGRNCAVIVQKFVKPSKGKIHKPQLTGKKRGTKNKYLTTPAEVAASEIITVVKKAFDSYIQTGNMSWKSAYYEMITTQFGIPPELLSKENNNILIDPDTIAKYRLPTWNQFRYRCRQEKFLNRKEIDELPRGARGTVSETIPGPGFYEIDATFFQIQLVSRITKGLLVGRPAVYLIVDLYDGIIAGYAVTLENPSWATAALALHNCFSPKQPIFDRLGLPYTEDDWPCHHLPNMLRADRAELISNMGQHFNRSGIRVEITPSMTPIAKGTVEGKHASLKSKNKGRFNLPGQYSKYLKRRETNGKKEAALDLYEFEKILVEIIMDLNRSAVRPKQIPPDAVAFGAAVATRTGLHKWAIQHRPGFTRNMPQNFVYEFLLTQAQATVSTLGIHCHGELYNCDELRAFGYLTKALHGNYKITVCYNPLFAAEIFYFNPENSSWRPAFNTDLEVYRLKASFSEVKEFRHLQRQLIRQAELEGHIVRQARKRYVRDAIKDAVKVRSLDRTNVSNTPYNIVANRAEEKALHRVEGINGAIGYNITDLSTEMSDCGGELVDLPSVDLTALWGEVDAIQKD